MFDYILLKYHLSMKRFPSVISIRKGCFGSFYHLKNN